MVKRKKKVLVGLSGGVDSAVSAYLLLKEGYEVEGVFMKNWSSTVGLKLSECPWLKDRQEALRVAAFLGIPLHTLDFEKQYQDKVMSYFFREYKAGRTPNPDVMCNKEIKFKLLYEWATRNGFDYLATGHYARIGQNIGRAGNNNRNDQRLNGLRFTLQRSKDEFKDQTYFIYNIRPEQLPRLLFPIGGFKKEGVKKLAKKIGLPNAGRKESMGLCFVGKVRLKDFLEQKIKPKPGKILLLENSKQKAVNRKQNEGLGSIRQPADHVLDSKLIGTHQGLHNFTLGQRQGLKVGGSGPYYVLSKDKKKNILYVTKDPKDPRLDVQEVEIENVNWLQNSVNRKQKTVNRKNEIGHPSLDLQLTTYNLLARYRHQGELVPCKLEKLNEKKYKVKFKKPQHAVSSGQSLVLYSGKTCLGGGVIC